MRNSKVKWKIVFYLALSSRPPSSLLKLSNFTSINLILSAKQITFIYTSRFIVFGFNTYSVITQGYVRVTNKFARLYFLSFHLLCVIVVLK